MILFCCASELGLPEDLSAIEVILLLLLLYDSFLRDGGLGSAEGVQSVQRTESVSSDCSPSSTQFQLFKW